MWGRPCCVCHSTTFPRLFGGGGGEKEKVQGPGHSAAPPHSKGPQSSRASVPLLPDTALPSPWPLGSPEMSCGSPAAPHTESPVPVPPFQRLLSRLWPQGSRRLLGCHGEVPSCLGGRGSGGPRAASSLQAEEHPRSPPPAREKRSAAASGRWSGGSHAKLFKPQCRWGGCHSLGTLAHPVLRTLAHQVLAASAFSASSPRPFSGLGVPDAPKGDGVPRCSRSILGLSALRIPGGFHGVSAGALPEGVGWASSSGSLKF